MNYKKKYKKYKYKYLNEKIKLIGGYVSHCLLVDAHGSEIPGDIINLKDDQLVILYYKPFCIHRMSFDIIKVINKLVTKLECSTNYMILQYIFSKILYNMDYLYILDDYAIYSGNKLDINFFDTILDDGHVKTNDISIIPDIEFEFEEDKNIINRAYSFPVSESSYINDKFNEYHFRKIKEIDDKTKRKIDIFYKSTGDKLKLSECLDKYGFKFVWTLSCRYLPFEYHAKHPEYKRIGIPFIIFFLYTYYRIIIDILEIKYEEIFEIDRKFYTRVNKIFSKNEYSENKVDFINKFMDVLIEALLGILEFKSIDIFFLESRPSRFRPNRLSTIVQSVNRWYSEQNNVHSSILMILDGNSQMLGKFLSLIKSKKHFDLDSIFLKHMSILAHILHMNIDTEYLLNEILKITKYENLELSDILDRFELLNYDVIVSYDIDDLKKIKNE